MDGFKITKEENHQMLSKNKPLLHKRTARFLEKEIQ
jgi:hypothetical protein